MTEEQSRCRQNFHEQCEANINRQINMELYACYVYQALSFYFDRDDVALKGFARYFKKASDEERVHAEKFMTYQNKRGGRIVLQDIKKPEFDKVTCLESMEMALALEKEVNRSLLDIHQLCSTLDDPQMCDFLETEYLEEQVNANKELSDHITNLKRVGPGLGEYIYDKEAFGEH